MIRIINIIIIKVSEDKEKKIFNNQQKKILL